MKVIAIKDAKTRQEANLLDLMYALRRRVFFDRLSWNVDISNGREVDEFDALEPSYVLVLSPERSVVGCVRFLPATGPTMLDIVFPQLLRSGRLNAHEAMVESSRFCVDTSSKSKGNETPLHPVTRVLFAAMMEFCLVNCIAEIATATDVRVERILRRAGWPMRRLGDINKIGATISVAGILPVTEALFCHMRPEGYQSDLGRQSC